MALTFAQGLTILQSRIGDSSNTTAATQALNAAQREAARKYRWPELMTRAFVNTVAAYDTGTVATDGTTSVTLTGGTFPTDVATGKYRFALSVSDPWYGIATRSSGTVVLLAQAYVDPNQTASAYVVYKSHLSLASDVDRVEQMWLHKGGEAVELTNANTDQEVSDFTHFPTGIGVPTHFLMMERDASNQRQVLLGPDTPDAVYRVEYVYRKQTTDGTLALDDSRWPAVLELAVAILYEPEYQERAQRARINGERLLAQEWASECEVETQATRVGQNRVDLPGLDMDALMGRGRVQDPS